VPQVRWSFSWTCKGRIVIPLGVPRKDGRYLVIPLDVPKEDMFISFGMPREDGRYLGLTRLPGLNALSLTCLLDLRYLGHA